MKSRQRKKTARGLLRWSAFTVHIQAKVCKDLVKRPLMALSLGSFPGPTRRFQPTVSLPSFHRKSRKLQGHEETKKCDLTANQTLPTDIYRQVGIVDGLVGPGFNFRYEVFTTQIKQGKHDYKENV